MHLREKFKDWGTVFLACVVMSAALYGIWADALDGNIINPILEMGTRSKEFTHRTTKCVYHPGEMVYAEVIFQKNRNVIGTIQWHLVNHHLVTYKERNGSLPVGIWDKKVPVEQIPSDAEPGEYWFAGTVTYHPNAIGKVVYSIWSNKFEVKKP